MTEKQAREERMRRLTRDACLVRAQVEQQVLDHYGAVLSGHRALLDALLDVELIRLEAAEDVAEKGLRERYSNGRQTLERKNPATDIMLRAAATEAKIISALGLNKRKQAAPATDGGDAADDAEDMDIY